MVRPAYIAEHKQAENADQYLEKANKLQAAAQAAETKAGEDLKTFQASLTKAQAEKAAAAAQKEEVVKLLEKQNADKDAAAKELADTQAKINDFGNVETMTAELKSLEGKRAEYDSQIENAKGAIASALARKANTDKLIASVKRIDLWQRSGSMPDAFSSRVSAVNSEWGFVTIAAGNASSVVNQAKLDVTRGGALIGRVIVTQVNPNSSVAEIVPGTVNPGDSILPGDRVTVNIASKGSLKSEPAPTKPAAPAKGATDPAAPPEAPAAPAADPFATPSDAPAAPAADPAVPAPASETPPADPAAPAPAADPAAPVEPPATPPADAPAPAPGN